MIKWVFEFIYKILIESNLIKVGQELMSILVCDKFYFDCDTMLTYTSIVNHFECKKS